MWSNILNINATTLLYLWRNPLCTGISWIIAVQNMVPLINSGQFEDSADTVSDEYRWLCLELSHSSMVVLSVHINILFTFDSHFQFSTARQVEQLEVPFWILTTLWLAQPTLYRRQSYFSFVRAYKSRTQKPDGAENNVRAITEFGVSSDSTSLQTLVLMTKHVHIRGFPHLSLAS